MEISKCSRCDGEMVSGHLVDYVGTQFTPHNLPFFASLKGRVGRVPIEAFMCASCGQIELRGDVSKLQKVLKK